MLITTFKDIIFPVYKLGSTPPNNEGGVLYYEKEYKDRKYKYYLDDINIIKPTLAKRRMELLKSDKRLFPLKIALFFLGDFIKVAKSRVYFIDATGKIFTYKKSIRASLKYYVIKQNLRTPTGGSIIEVYGISSRFKALFYNADARYAGILKHGAGYILYGLYETRGKNTYRLV
jgi:hypothetical protein